MMRMRTASAFSRSFRIILVLSMLVAGVLVAPSLPPTRSSAIADTLPPDPGLPATVSADPLPTVQIDGVVWSQVAVGNIVYVAGRFQNARPAGSAPGVNNTPRHNLLAYNITTGDLVAAFAPDLNGQALTVAASPDGSRLYVGGDFTMANGQPRYRIAAYNLATNALDPTFRPIMGAQVHAIVATNTTVYVGGLFTTAAGLPRTRLAAISASTGTPLNWTPSADSTVMAMTLNYDKSKLIVAGRFQQLNGAPVYGMGALDPNTGATVSWLATAVIKNAGSNASLWSLTADADGVYGAGYVFGAGGNFEGAFRADNSTGAILWLEDCHGDSYSAFPFGDVVYVASHAHNCATIGGYPEFTPRIGKRATAFSKKATGTVATNTQGGYTNFAGNPAPTMLDWFPEQTIGTFTGQSQASWNITGSGDYLSYGGEFIRANGVAQQGLVRYAVKSVAPNKVGPEASSAMTPRVQSFKPGTARLSWQSTYDQDNESLTYKVFRTSDLANPIYSTTVRSTFWQNTTLQFTDTGLTPGAQYTYTVIAYDGFGNSRRSPNVAVTVATASTERPYPDRVLSDGASTYWRLAEASGTTAADTAGFTPGTVIGGVALGSAGSLQSEPSNTAATFDGSSGFLVNGGRPIVGPQVFTIQAWISTTTTSGGKIIGFGNSSNTASSATFDRHLYMDNSGRIYFGVYSGAPRVINSTASFNDGAWHQLTGTLSGAGMALYIDGKLIASRSDVKSAQQLSGYWHVGADSVSGWTGQPSSRFFNGRIDEVAIYGTALSAAAVDAQFVASGRTSGLPNTPPTAAFTSTNAGLSVTFNGSNSADAEAPVAGYSWNFGDGGSGSGVSVQHPYPAAGTYTVTLTVTDSGGLTASTSRAVTVTAASTPTVYVSDNFGRTVANGLGSAETGGAWKVVGSSSLFAVDGSSAAIRLAGAGSGPSANLGAVSARDVEGLVDISFDKAATGDGTYSTLALRWTATGSYQATVRILPASTTITLFKSAGGVRTTLGTATVAGLIYSPGDVLRIKFSANGSSTTALSTKVWKSGVPEPGWQLTRSDSTSALPAGGIALTTYLSPSATNAPVVVGIDNLLVTSAPVG